jgi:hypothetical protein
LRHLHLNTSRTEAILAEARSIEAAPHISR